MTIRWVKKIDSAYAITEAGIQGFDAVLASLSAPMELDEASLAVYSWTEYLRLALARASMLGCKTLVWGDSDARTLPVEGETSILKEHFNQFLFMLCDIAERHGIRVCVEPLGPRRTNFLNRFPEEIRLSRHDPPPRILGRRHAQAMQGRVERIDV